MRQNGEKAPYATSPNFLDMQNETALTIGCGRIPEREGPRSGISSPMGFSEGHSSTCQRRSLVSGGRFVLGREMVKRSVGLIVSLGVVACVVLATVLVLGLRPISESERLQIDETNFVIRAESFKPNLSIPIDTLVLCSNGSAWHDSLINWAEPIRHDNRSETLSSGTVLDILHSLERENFLSLKDRYYDRSSFALKNWISTLAIESKGKSKTVTFDWNSIVGVLPYSEVKMAYVAEAIDRGESRLLNISLNVTAQASADPSVVTINGVVTNNESFVFTGYAVGGEYNWSVAIVRNDGFMIARFPSSVSPGADGWFRFDPHTSSIAGAFLWDITGLQPGGYAITGAISGNNGNATGCTVFHIPLEH